MTHPSILAVIHVDVSVDAKGDITCDPNPVSVNAANALIVFDVSTPGYTFPNADAIVVDPADPSFPIPSWTITATEASLLDLCNQPGSVDYTVNLVETATGRTLSVDPVIQNGSNLP